MHEWMVSEIDNKWHKFGPWHVATTGASTIMQAVKFGNEEPAPKDIAGFVAWLRRLFVVHQIKPNDEGEYPGYMLVARGKKVWKLDSALHANEFKQGFWATAGAGADIAAGALDAFDECGSGALPPSDVARLVLGIAEKRCAGVRGCRVEVVPYGPEPVEPLGHAGYAGGSVRQMTVPE
jgi:hypothetical protein